MSRSRVGGLTAGTGYGTALAADGRPSPSRAGSWSTDPPVSSPTGLSR
jgi:hypothetical protein